MVDDPLVTLVAGPLAERMIGLRWHPAGEHKIGILGDLTLREIVGGGDGAHVKHLVFGRDRRERVGRGGEHGADQHVDLVLQDELLRLGDVDVGLALVVLDDEGNLGAAEHSVVLIQIQLEAVDHVGAELREDARARRQEADAQVFRLRRRTH